MNIRHLFVAMALVAATASASVADDKLDQAKVLFDTAQADYAVKSYSKAGEGFLAAYELRSDIPAMLFNAGVAFQKAGERSGLVADYESSVAAFGRFLSVAPSDSSSDSVRARVTTLTTEIEKLKATPAPADGSVATPSAEVTALDGALIKGVYVIESNPSGAEIYLNNVSKTPFARTPWSGVIEGTPTLVFTLRGYKPHTAVLPTSPNGLVVKSVDLGEITSKGYLTIISNPPGANVYIDDKANGSSGQTPFAQDMIPGKHTIFISADGYDDYSQVVDIAQGETPLIEVKLNGSPLGYVDLRGDGIEISRVYIDGKLECDPGPCRRGLREGRHEIKVTRAGHKPLTKRVEIQAKAETIIRTELAEKPFKWDAVFAYALTGAFAGGGIYLGLQANSLRDELDRDIAAGMPPVDANDPRFLRGKIYSIAANAAYGLAGISFLTAVYYTFRDKGPASRASVDTKTMALTPTVGATYAGLDMAVTW